MHRIRVELFPCYYGIGVWIDDRLYNGLGEAFDGFRGLGYLSVSLVRFLRTEVNLPEKEGREMLCESRESLPIALGWAVFKIQRELEPILLSFREADYFKCELTSSSSSTRQLLPCGD
jgi:hypothetical protein